MEHNKYTLSVGDIVVIDRRFKNGGLVKIIRFSPNKMFTEVQSYANGKLEGEIWQTMTNRLTPVNQPDEIEDFRFIQIGDKFFQLKTSVDTKIANSSKGGALLIAMAYGFGGHEMMKLTGKGIPLKLLIETYKKVINKESDLSRSKREQIIHTFNLRYKEI